MIRVWVRIWDRVRVTVTELGLLLGLGLVKS